MARLVAPGGHVFSYDPAGQTRALLARSKQANRAENLHVIAAALSDGERGSSFFQIVALHHLTFAGSSELNSLVGGDPEAIVKVTSLDAETASAVGATSISSRSVPKARRSHP